MFENVIALAKAAHWASAQNEAANLFVARPGCWYAMHISLAARLQDIHRMQTLARAFGDREAIATEIRTIRGR